MEEIRDRQRSKLTLSGKQLRVLAEIVSSSLDDVIDVDDPPRDLPHRRRQDGAALALHGKRLGGYGYVCTGCTYGWPCPTVKALKGEK